MSKYALQALITAAADNNEIRSMLEDSEGHSFDHIVHSLLSLDAHEKIDFKNTLKNKDVKKSTVGKLDERNTPGPTVTG